MANPSTNLYSAKSVDYFAKARTEIAPLLPGSVSHPLRVLEIGCSQGHTLDWLKRTGRCIWAAGVEPYAQPVVPEGVIDRFFKLDIETSLPDISHSSVDLILCLDVLEHLVDPWKTVQRIDPFLKPGGTLIISVPNVRNYHVLMNLLFKGRFEYTNEGILDRTHLRFFTRSSAIDLAQSSDAKVQQILTPGLDRWQKRILASIGLKDLLARQLILQAIKPQ